VPWLIPLLLITYVPAGRLGAGGPSLLVGLAALAGLAVSPLLSAGAYTQAAAAARGDSSARREALRAGARSYLPLLGWDLLQWLLGLAAASAALALWRAPADEREFAGMLAVAAGAWGWGLARLWGFYFVPLLVVRGQGARGAARLATLLIVDRPGRALLLFAARQLLLAALALSGLGLLFAAGGGAPLQACLAVREGLRRRGLELAPFPLDGR
jgi:hypothetical protein